MEKNIEKYVFVKQNFLDKEFCQNTIEKINQLNIWKKHDWQGYDSNSTGSSFPSGENEPEQIISVEEISLKNINEFIIPKIIKVVEEYIESCNLNNFDLHGMVNLKFIKYSLNQTMKEHCDHIHDIFDGKAKGIPIFTVIGLLNDDYEGGNLVMFGDKKINTKKGDLIVFPSLFLFPHEIKPITKGIRYSYITWVW